MVYYNFSYIYLTRRKYEYVNKENKIKIKKFKEKV